jgi:hypothetical protein
MRDLDVLTLKMEPTGCTETPVKDYHSTLRNIPEELRTQNMFYFLIIIIGGRLTTWFSAPDWGFCVSLLRVHLPMYLCSVFGFVVCRAPLNSCTVTTFWRFASLWCRGVSMMGQFLFHLTDETARACGTAVTVGSWFPCYLHALSDVSRCREQLHSKVQLLVPGVHHEIACGHC